jgi:hypothetical protein
MDDPPLKKFSGVPLDPGVDTGIERDEKAVGFLLKDSFNRFGILGVKKEFDLLTDEGYRSFIKLAIETDGTVFCDPSSGTGSEVNRDIVRGFSQTFEMCREPGKRGFASGAVFFLMVVGKPCPERIVQIGQGVCC